MKFLNEGVWDNGYIDYGVYWWFWYEVDNFLEFVKDFWRDLELFYKELYVYVWYKFVKEYF